MQDVKIEIEATKPSLQSLVSELTSNEAKELILDKQTKMNIVMLRILAKKDSDHTLYVMSSETGLVQSAGFQWRAEYHLLTQVDKDSP